MFGKPLVILLHGVGARGRDLAPLGDLWKRDMPDVRFVAPDAPEQMGYGYQWFSVQGVTAENRPGRIATARAAFDDLIRTILDEGNIGTDLSRVAFAGFSQGTIMALDALASGRWPVAAVLGYSGRLVTPQPLAPSTGTRVLLVHGSTDPVIDAQETRSAARTLEAHGVSVDMVIEPGVGHTISMQGADHGRRFLSEVFAR